MNWVDKIWGKTRELICSPFYAKYELDVIAGGYCSLHYHQHRANRFIVGTARIRVLMLYGPKIEKYDLGPDNMLDVPSLVPHLFCVYAAGSLFEEYYPDRGGSVQQNDIIRLCEGGWLDEQFLDDLPHNLPTGAALY